jgi:hypothetical protein
VFSGVYGNGVTIGYRGYKVGGLDSGIGNCYKNGVGKWMVFKIREGEMAQTLVIYLDTDVNGDDLLDSGGNPIPAGWYRYTWPLSGAGDDGEGPFATEIDAADGIAL